MLSLGILCLLVTASCATTASPHRGDGEVESRHDAASRTLVDAAPTPGLNQGSRGMLGEAPLERADLHIQRSGWIRVNGGVEMEDSAKLRRMARDFDATVMSFNDHSVTFKMPSARLESLLDVLGSTPGWEIDEFDFSAWDRSGEFYAVEARIESARAVRERLLKLLEMAATVDEVIKVHNKLEDIQKSVDTLQTTAHDVKLHSGRVDVVILFD